MSLSPFSFLEARTGSAAENSDRVLVVAAHPDDEAIGTGGHLPTLADPRIFFVTDGAPRNAYTAEEAVSQYAETRKAEARAALGLAGISEDRIDEAGIKDQEASRHLHDLVKALCEAIQKGTPSVVLTHPYEGGHPDHDATAFAVRTASTFLNREGASPPLIVEFTSYHNSAAGLEVCDFVDWENTPVLTVRLSDAQRGVKRRIFQAYQSQSKVLQAFPVEVERFRLAPMYDFTKPPHVGKLYYENFEWGVTGNEWRSLAAAALGELDLSA
ncbi:MAG TPA: PIG-L deacetylase family protein [Terriglobia bacterium]|nr:PIG-L deacetylase family protein [Terriglobia bacterium]